MNRLIVIDMQNDFRPSDTVVENVVKKINKYVSNNEYVYLTMDTHTKDEYNKTQESLTYSEHCIEGSTGCHLIPEVGKAIALHRRRDIIEKDTFASSTLAEYIKQDINSSEIYANDVLEIVGVASDVCVISNALLLRSVLPTHKIVVDASCCAGITPEGAEAAYKVMKSCAINVIGC